MAVTLAQIIADAKDLADLNNNPVVSEQTWRTWVNRGQESLYRLLVAKAPSRFHASAPFTLAGGVGGNTVAVAANFRQLREGGVTRDPDVPAMRRTLRRYAFGERDAQGALRAWGYGAELGYDIQADGTGATIIIIEPAPTAGGNYAYYYVRGPVTWATNGSGDAVTIDVIFEPYVDYIAHWAAIKGAIKDESTEAAAALKLDLRDIADEIMVNFDDSADPGVIYDVYRTGGVYRR